MIVPVREQKFPQGRGADLFGVAQDYREARSQAEVARCSRDALICKALDEGFSIRWVAERVFRLAYQVHRIRSERRERDNQPPSELASVFAGALRGR